MAPEKPLNKSLASRKSTERCDANIVDNNTKGNNSVDNSTILLYFDIKLLFNFEWKILT